MADRMSVIVVGAGVAGLMTAWRLAERGAQISIIEKDSVGSHASGFAFGALNSLTGAAIPGPLLEPAVASARLHRDLMQTLPQAAGMAVPYTRNPLLNVAFAPDEAEALRNGVAWRRKYAPEARWLDAKQVLSFEPRLAPHVLGGLLLPDTYEVDAYRFTLALLHAAERAGATLRHGEVTGLTARGRSITGVRMGSQELGGDTVVLAQGPWAAAAQDWLGVTIPVRPVKGEILRLSAPGRPFSAHTAWGHCYASSKPDGLAWVGTTEEDAGMDERPSQKAREEVLAGVLERIPSLEGARLVRQTACLRPVTPDTMPLVGKAPGWDGAWLCTGGGRKGILLSPVMGGGLADLIAGGATDLPLDGMDPGRFAAGSPRTAQAPSGP